MSLDTSFVQKKGQSLLEAFNFAKDKPKSLQALQARHEKNESLERAACMESEQVILEDCRDIMALLKSISDTNCSGEYMVGEEARPPLAFFIGTIASSIIGNCDRAEKRINEREAMLLRVSAKFRAGAVATGEIDAVELARLKAQQQANELERHLAVSFAKAGKEIYSSFMGKEWEPWKPAPESRKLTANEINAQLSGLK